MKPCAVLVVVGLLLAGCSEQPTQPTQSPQELVKAVHGVDFSEQQWSQIQRMAAVPELPDDPTNRFANDVRAAEFGHHLFFDTRLSPSNTVSCATCHDPALDFTDGRAVAQGTGTNTRNTPTVLNAAYHRWLTWDGRADSLWAQALEPMENDVEMGGDRLSVVRLVATDPALRAQYEALFGSLPDVSAESLPTHARPRRDGLRDAWSEAWDQIEPTQQAAITAAFVNIGKSIGAYQRKLISTNAPFDRFVAAAESGSYERSNEFSDSAARGLALFVGEAGCWECHAGPMLTTGEFHDIGVPPVAGGMPTDSGRFAGADRVMADPFNAAGEHSDAQDASQARLVRSLLNSPDNWGRFRTPSLREVSRTAPYMHEGQFATLEDVVQYYSTLEGAVQLDHHQEVVLAPLGLTPQEQADLVAFLRSLDGEPRGPEWAKKRP